MWAEQSLHLMSQVSSFLSWWPACGFRTCFYSHISQFPIMNYFACNRWKINPRTFHLRVQKKSLRDSCRLPSTQADLPLQLYDWADATMVSVSLVDKNAVSSLGQVLTDESQRRSLGLGSKASLCSVDNCSPLEKQLLTCYRALVDWKLNLQPPSRNAGWAAPRGLDVFWLTKP